MPPRDRRPLRPDVLAAALQSRGAAWQDVRVVATTGSTNADAANAAAAGAPTGWAIAADEQTAGRGRLGRTWESPPGGSLAVSVVLRPNAPASHWGWLPLLAGVASVAAVRGLGVPAGLKWPNDVVVAGPARDGAPGPRKLGGILVERQSSRSTAADAAAVVGIGLNVDLAPEQLPTPAATSLALEGSPLRDREDLVADLLVCLHGWFERWEAAGGEAARSGLQDRYGALCLTVGQPVAVELPTGSSVSGRATGVDEVGRLLVDDGVRVTAYSSGDVRHLRNPAPGQV